MEAARVNKPQSKGEVQRHCHFYTTALSAELPITNGGFAASYFYCRMPACGRKISLA